MAKTRVFISHATKGEESAKPVNALCEALCARGFEAEFDKTFLKTNDDWYDRVNTAMAACDAAIILVDRQADESIYVHHEASVLGMRWHSEKSLQRPFVLFVALVDPDPAVNETLGASHLLKVFGRAPKLDRNQYYRPDPALLGTGDLGPLVEDLADKFVSIHGPPWSDETPGALARTRLLQVMQALVATTGKAVSSAISRSAERSDTLAALDADTRDLSERNKVDYLAFWLAENAVAAPKDTALMIRELASDFVLLDHGKREMVLKALFVLQAHWVADQECTLAAALVGNQGAVFALNGRAAGRRQNLYTARLYPAYRLFEGRYHFIGEFDENETDAAAIADSLADQWFLEPNGLAPLSPDCARKLSRVFEANERQICVLPSDFAKPEYEGDLVELVQKFGAVLFLVPLKDAFETADLGAVVQCTAPAIDLDREDDYLFYWQQIKSAIAKTSEGVN